MITPNEPKGLFTAPIKFIDSGNHTYTLGHEITDVLCRMLWMPSKVPTDALGMWNGFETTDGGRCCRCKTKCPGGGRP